MSQANISFPIEPPVQALLEGIRRAGGRPLLVGGTVRDALLGHLPKDIDVEVFGLDGETLRQVAAHYGRVFAVGVSFGVLKVKLAGAGELDLSLPRRESLYDTGKGQRGFLATPDPAMTPFEAASRRDFTINAMYYDPAAGELLDFFEGQRDLQDGILRHVGPAFAEDPLRVLRGMQFAARWNFRVAPETAQFCAGLRPLYGTLAIERIWGEWHKLLLKGWLPSAGLEALTACGWRSLYPPLEQLAGQAYSPGETAWEHTLRAVNAAAAISARYGLAGETRVVLMLATLCHDMDLPLVGAGGAVLDSAQAFLKAIGCPQHYLKPVLPLLRERLAYRTPEGTAPTATAVRRLSLRLAPATIEQWERLVEAASQGAKETGNARPALPWLELARTLGCDRGPLPPLLLGRHLKEAGLHPGPRFGQLLEEALEAQLEGRFSTTEEAMAWLKSRLANNSS
ncbi:MAG TPA: polynucleotide adenylyltransferase [Chloroflexia bacterium]|nr:polynucleotide adenylyltransferase [Chloroflexia bacterium]